MSNYSTQWSSNTPGYLIFLVDQSSSMNTGYDKSNSRSESAALAINLCIHEICMSNMDGSNPRNRVFISIITYDSNVKEQKSGTLSDFYNSKLREERLTKKMSDGAGGEIEVPVIQPIWLEANAGGCTNMAGAFEIAKQLIEGWNQARPDAPAPVVINISDGAPYDGRTNQEQRCKDLFKQIQAIKTQDGEPLIFNVHIGSGNQCKFPNSRNEANSEEAQFLYDISSVVPDAYLAAAEKNNLQVKPQSRGMISNADARDLMKFINFGSSKANGGDLVK
ncbi:MAG: hypothetical protein RLZZ293_904 [Pseudomonadota bacterium]|jgi:uncharacterized protein YegL